MMACPEVAVGSRCCGWVDCVKGSVSGAGKDQRVDLREVAPAKGCPRIEPISNGHVEGCRRSEARGGPRGR